MMAGTTGTSLEVTQGAQSRPGSEDAAQTRHIYVSLKEMWEIYIKAVKSTDKSADNAKRQMMSLDIFLELCCEEMDRSNTLPHFSDVKSVCNQLCKEFMSDILHVTSSAEDDDITQLQKYLLEGRGWILLKLIHNTGAQTVSGGRDLAKLLVSLLPWCLKFPISIQDNNKTYEGNSLPQISSCFQDVKRNLHSKLSQQKTSIPMSRQSNRGSQNSYSSNGNLSHDSGEKSKTSYKHKLASNKEQSSGSDSDDDTNRTERSRGKIKRKHRFIYLRNSTDLHSQKMESDSEDEDIDLLLGKLHKEHRHTTGYELCILILHLLHDLTLSDLEQVSPVKYLSPGIIPDLLVTLSSKELEESNAVCGNDSNNEAYILIKHHILQVVLTCCGIIASQQNGVNILIGHKIVEKLLNVAQELNSFSIERSDDVLQNKVMLLKLNLLSDIVVGLLLCISIVFDCLPFNPMFIKSAKHLMEEFDGNRGFEQLQKVFHISDWLKSSGIKFDWMDDDPVKIFGNFLNTIKVVRVNYIHSMKCVKRKHQKCSYSEYFDHHHDILGVPANQPIIHEEDESLHFKGKSASQWSQTSQTPPSSQTVCMVAACTEVLLRGLRTAESKSMRLDVLRVIYSSGVCCCMNLEEVVKTFVASVEKFSPALRSYALETMNKVILEHFSGGMKIGGSSEGLMCTYCEAMSNRESETNVNSIYSYFHKPVLDELKGLDSGFSSGEIKRSFIVSAFHKLSKFRAVHLLRPLLYSENEAVAISIAKHLLVLAIKGNPFLKAELFFSIYMKTLRLFKVRGTQSTDSSQVSDNPVESSQKTEEYLSKTVQVHCLSALPYLLQANCVAKAFLAQQGILNMCRLLEDSILRMPVLRVFEALIVLDEEKLDETKGLSHSDACPHPYKGGSVIGAFLDELSKRSFCSELESDSDTTGEETLATKFRRVRHNSVVCNRFSLPVLVDLWETCAKLSLHNRLFVSQFLLLDCLRQTEGLLLETLEVLVSSSVMLVKSQASTETEDSGLEGDNVSGSGGKSEGNAFCMRVTLMESLVVVIGACCGHLEKEGSVVPRTWQKVEEMFDGSYRYEMSKLKLILDGLLNAGMPQYLSVLEYSYSRNIALVHMRDDDVYDEDEVRHLLQTGSESEHENVSTEMGYDADSEETNFDESEKDKHMKWCLIRSHTPQKVYFPSVFKLLFNLMITVNKEESGKLVVTSVLHKLLQNVRADKQLVQAMCREDILKLILDEDGFWSTLIMKEEEGIAQDVLLGFVQQFGQHKMPPPELQKILQLFQHSDIPMENLLSMFLTVVENSHIAPHHYLEFPVLTKGWSPAEWSEMMSEELETSGPTIGPMMKTMSNMLMLGGGNIAGNQAVPQQEVWDMCAMKMSLKESLTWPPFQKGFSVVMWVCLTEGQSNRFCPNMPLYNLETGSEHSMCRKSSGKGDYSTEKYLHLVSVGTREKMLEIWADTGTYSLLFRLTSEVCSTGLVVQEAELKGIISPATWQHLIFSYVESLDGSTLTGTANLVIDGWQDHTFSLDHPFSAIRQRDKTSQLYPQLFLGHAVKDIATNQLGTWSLGSLMLLKGASIPKETCFHLYTLGPNAESILKCDCSEESVSYAPHLHKNTILHSNIPHDALVGLRKPDLTDIRSSLLLTYSSKQKTMCMYTPLLKAAPQGQGSFSSDQETVLLTQQPRQVTPVVQGDLGSKVNCTLEKSVEESGGMAAILFLVAKIYENCHDEMNVDTAESLQSRALQVLFAIVHHSSRLEQEYINIGGHSLLAKVLTSCRSTVGYSILKVLLDAATTESLFKCPTSSDTLAVRQKSEAVVRDATIIEHLVMNWNIWEGSHKDIMDLLFQALASLVREDHPNQGFNIKQFQVINLVNKIFRIYQERIQDSHPSLPVTVGQSAVTIIQNMIGSPPDYHMIMDLCDFLLNVHPAAKTYISHSRSGFYFNLSWGIPPSPLSKWRQDQKALMTSTPVKKRTSLPTNTLSGTKRVLLKTLDSNDKAVNRVHSHQEFPSVEVEDLTKPRSVSEPPVAVRQGISPVMNGPNVQKQDSMDKTVEEAAEAGASDPDQQNKNTEFFLGSSLEKSSKSSEHSTDEQENLAALRTRGLTIHVDGLLNISTNWDALYKKDGEPIQEWRENEGEAGLASSKNEMVDNTEPVQNLGDSETKVGPPAARTDNGNDSADGFESFKDFLGNEIEAGGELHDSDPDDSSRDQSSFPSKENLSINFDETDADLAQAEEGLAALCVGLLRLLSTIIDMMPDSLSDKIFQKSIINPKTLIVLANSGSPEIRSCVIKVLSSYLKRCSPPQLDMFLKIDGFQLLASQLFQYPTYHEQMDEAVSVVLQRSFRLDDGLQDGDCLDELSKIQQSSACLFLALLGNSTGDLALCHNSLQFCCELFENSNVLASVLVDAGLIEVLCSMITKLFDNDKSCSSLDMEGVDPNEILLSDIQNVLKLVALREFRASGPQHYQHFEDILTLLKELEIKEGEKHGEESKGVHTMRIFQHVILSEVFNLIEKASEEVSQQSFSIFPKSTQTSRSLTNVLDVTASQHSSSHQPTNPATKSPSSFTQLQYALTGSFAKMSIHRKSSQGFFARTDLPTMELFGGSGSGGDSDSSSQDSLVSSVQTVNFPILKTGTSHRKTVETSQDRLIRSNSLLQSVLSIGKRKKLATIPISQNELIDRLKKVLTLAIDLTVFTDRKPPAMSKKVLMLFENTPYSVNADRKFQTRLFNFTYRAFEATLQQEKSIYKRTKNVIMWGAKDVLRVQLGRLLAFMLSNKQEVDNRIYALSYMMGEARGTEVLRLIISSPELGNDYAYLMYQLLTGCQQWLSHQQYEDGSKFINVLSGAGITVLSPRKKQDIEYLEEKQRSMDVRHNSAKEMWLKRKETSLQRILHKFDSLSSKLTDSAMEVTQVVSQLQTQERKKFITHLKQNMTDKVAVKKQWQELVQNLTHERAVWFDRKSYPQSWELNPTEGPCRVRKRLQRGHLGINSKFLKKETQYKLDSEKVDPPLIYLFEEDHQKLSEAPALIYQLHINKKIRYTTKCTTVSPNNESEGELLIGEDSIFFVADEAVTDANYTQALLGNKDQLSMTWPFEDVVEIHRRWFELSDRGLEIFLTNGKTCLLAFDSSQDRDRLYQYLLMLELPNRRDTGNLFDGLDRWQNGQMTNFEYLTYLNKQAGRSFNDLMQYPVFPFILSDYTNEKIDLRNPRIYRDLVKPVSVQDPKNEQKFRDNYEILKSEYEKFGRAGMGSAVSGKPFHYGSHYSSSGTVLHFLVRLPPFTKMFINFQDQSFDIPDRTFHNLHTSWRLSSAESNTDVKEMIPEFFFTHEFLINSEGFNFGHRQNGSEVSDVCLPPWCKKSARLFTLIHRQALESDYVSDNITHWIDLVFGYKQQGEHAVKAINVFHPATYYGLDISSVKDSTDRKAIQTMVRTYGQTPKQLFRVPHPPKKNIPQPRMSELRAHWGPQYQTVEGLKWGNYLGSPSQPDPEPVWEETYSSQVASLIPLPMGVVFGISPNSCLLAQYSQDKQQKAILADDPGDVTWAAILTWGMSDGLVRIINGKNKPAVNFVQHSPFEEITCCVSVPDCRHLFIGGTSGVITFYNTKYNPAKECELQIFGHKKCLYGHTKTVTAMVVCKPYSVLVSASEDCTCIIWDLNRLSYVRSIASHKTEVKVVAISDTLGDIASVSRHGLGSTLHLHTINAELVATTTCKETINCLSYSSAPEGLSINIIAGGLSSGTIRMWSSWDLSVVRELNLNSLLATPIISLTFTHDSQRLFTSSSDGRVIVWDMTKQRVRSVRFRPFLYPADAR